MILCALLALVLARAGCQLLAPAASSSASFPRQRSVYELAGAVRSPGIYSFDSPRTLRQLLEAAGAQEQAPGGADSGTTVASGMRIVAGSRTAFEPMSARDRINYFLPLPVNMATAEDLTLIPGMGLKTAQAIVQYRQRAGGVRDLRELENLEGIGGRRLELFSPYLTVEDWNSRAPVQRPDHGM
jgi:competence protein ComEA